MQKSHNALKTCLISAMDCQLSIVSLLVGSVFVYWFEGCFLEFIETGSLDVSMFLDETVRGFPEKTSQ